MLLACGGLRGKAEGSDAVARRRLLRGAARLVPLRCSLRGAAAMPPAPGPERAGPIETSRRSPALSRRRLPPLRCAARARRPRAPSAAALDLAATISGMRAFEYPQVTDGAAKPCAPGRRRAWEAPRSAGLAAARAARFHLWLAAAVRTQRARLAEWVLRRGRKPEHRRGACAQRRPPPLRDDARAHAALPLRPQQEERPQRAAGRCSATLRFMRREWREAQWSNW